MLQVIYIYESHVLFPQLLEKSIYFLHFIAERKIEKNRTQYKVKIRAER